MCVDRKKVLLKFPTKNNRDISANTLTLIIQCGTIIVVNASNILFNAISILFWGIYDVFLGMVKLPAYPTYSESHQLSDTYFS